MGWSSDFSPELLVIVTDRLEQLVRTALDSAGADGIIGDPDVSVHFEHPRRREHGDWSTNVALGAAGPETKARSIAEALVERLPASPLIEKVEVAGPGFLNFYLSPRWLEEVVRRAADPEAGFGTSNEGGGAVVDLEFVSANPTGPLNVVSGRHAAVGDAVGKLLEATGHRVTREFYLNDAGQQATKFGESIAVRYLQLFGREGEIPEGGYHGDYVQDLARELADRDGDALVSASDEERLAAARELGLSRMLDEIRSSLDRFGTRFDVWFSERTLTEAGGVEAGIHELVRRGVTEERDGALWFLSSRFGDDKDRVLVRSDGRPTYLASDVAYMVDKIGRGFDRLIYLLGSDHHGTISRLQALADALDFGRDRLEINIVQLVTLWRGGERLKASKRAGVLIPLDELVEEVGADAARYTFLTRSMDAPLEFDIDLVKEQAPENPVFYVQYAHARINSIVARATDQGITPQLQGAPLERLVHPSEQELMRKLALYEEVVPEATRTRAPQRMVRFVEELAASFSAFYRDCKVVTDDADLTQARLALCVATQRVLASGLSLLCVSAPKRM
ncbi:MAG: arginyl-tRNA synthetase [Actinomycetota bacterium]|nr:arginyl-tRNA synthetase [Actinomycetota bacterium]